MDTFRALVVDKTDGGVAVAVREWAPEQLMPGEVTLRVEYSGVNYKDALAARADGRVARVYPLIPGIDMAGTVLESGDARVQPGDRVIVGGFELGVSHHGGFAQRARVPAAWVVVLPDGLSTRQAAALGTAGLTAALSVERLELNGLRQGSGPVLVTGASGGVGSAAVDMLARLGYAVTASSGSADAHAYLRTLGADAIVDRAETSAPGDRPLDKARWAGAVDAVGGGTLAYIVSTLMPGGSVAVSGNVGGAAVHTTVLPFILRGVNVLGIETATLPRERRAHLWQRLATDLRPRHLDTDIAAHEVRLDDLPAVLERIHAGRTRGRVVVNTGA